MTAQLIVAGDDGVTIISIDDLEVLATLPEARVTSAADVADAGDGRIGIQASYGVQVFDPRARVPVGPVLQAGNGAAVAVTADEGQPRPRRRSQRPATSCS